MKHSSSGYMKPIMALMLAMPISMLAATASVQDGVEPAPNSRLTAIALPVGAHYLTDEGMLAEITPQLRNMAGQLNKQCEDQEVLVWGGETYGPDTAGAIIQNLATRMTEVGWTYKDQPVPGEAGSPMRIVAAERHGKAVGGFWLVTKEILVLAWCRLGAGQGTQKSHGPEKNVSHPEDPLASGEPPLTRNMVNRYADFIAWLLEIPLDNERRRRLSPYSGQLLEGEQQS